MGAADAVTATQSGKPAGSTLNCASDPLVLVTMMRYRYLRPNWESHTHTHEVIQ